jgi:arylsulfatase A-like enzyme
VNQNNNEANLIVSKSGIDLRMSLLPKRLKEAGYATAMTGKGHLGARSPANLPINRGFDRHFGFLKGGEDHMTQCLGDTDFHGPDLWRDHGPAHGENGTFSTLLYGREAVRIVQEHKLPQPLYMYLPYQVTQSPYQIPPGYEQASDPVQRRTFNAMVNIMDEATGNLTAALTARGMIDDTLIVFSADNGGVYHRTTADSWAITGHCVGRRPVIGKVASAPPPCSGAARTCFRPPCAGLSRMPSSTCATGTPRCSPWSASTLPTAADRARASPPSTRWTSGAC